MTADPVMAGGLASLAMTGLLRAQPHNYIDRLEDDQRVEGPASIRNAIALIETKAADIVSVTQLATAAGLSVRPTGSRGDGVSLRVEARTYK